MPKVIRFRMSKSITWEEIEEEEELEKIIIGQVRNVQALEWRFGVPPTKQRKFEAQRQRRSSEIRRLFGPAAQDIFEFERLIELRPELRGVAMPAKVAPEALSLIPAQIPIPEEEAFVVRGEPFLTPFRPKQRRIFRGTFTLPTGEVRELFETETGEAVEGTFPL